MSRSNAQFSARPDAPVPNRPVSPILSSVGHASARNSPQLEENMTSYDEQIAHISANVDYKALSKHLVSPEETLKLQGGDVARYLYQQIENSDGGSVHSGSHRGHRTRSLSFLAFQTESRRESTASNINVPGGFRREFLINKAVQANAEPPNFLTRNFVEFLSIYGHFAGEDFSDDEDADDDENSFEDVFDEELALLSLERRVPPPPPRRKQQKQAPGTASTTKTFFLVFKALVGSGVLFLPRAFCNGGLLFSTVALTAFGVLTFVCYLVLIKSKNVLNRTSYGELGFKTYGRPLKVCILISIIILQIGFVSTYVIFTAENVRAFLYNVLGFLGLSTANIVVLQALLLVPLVLIRNLAKLLLVLLISLGFIVIGLLIIFYYLTLQLMAEGLGPNIVQFNPNSWSMLIGVAVTSFEGIGLILPIEAAMSQPERFPMVLGISMAAITALFVAIGVVGYSTFGENVQSIIILNLPQKELLVQLILVLYSLAVFLTGPLQLFPAIRIGESVIFNLPLFVRAPQKLLAKQKDNEGRLYQASGKYSSRIKWLKNIFRAFSVVFVCSVAYLNADNLDKFVSFNGCFACIPLVYIYPPLIHLKTYQVTKQDGWKDRMLKIFDYVLIVAGIVAVVYTTYQITVLN